jgi:hypothetical protein
MRYSVNSILGIAILSLSSALAQPMQPPEIPEGEIRVFKSFYARESDQPDLADPIMKAIVDFTPVWYSGQVNWQGAGDERRLILTRKSRLQNGARTEAVFTFDTHPVFRLVNYTNVTYAPDGTKVADEFYNFTNPALRYPPDTFHVIVGNLIIRASELWLEREIEFTVWLTSTMVYPFRYKVVGEEIITTPAGTFDCYKIEGGLVSEGLTDITGIVINLATGRYYFWVEKGGTHGFVKLRWPISSGVIPGRTRYQTQELIEIRHCGETREQ